MKLKPDSYFDKHRAICYRWLPCDRQYYVTLPRTKRARTRAYIRTHLHGAFGWLEVPLPEALDAIASSRWYKADDRHPVVKEYCDLWESAQ